MPLAEARALLPPPVHILPDDPSSDREALARLAESLEPFSPQVGLEERVVPDTIFLNVTGLGHLFCKPSHAFDEGERELGRQVIQHCRRKGLLPRVCVADTLGLAWGVVRHLPPLADEEPLWLPPGDSATLLSLPVAALRLEPNQVETLERLGIVRIDQLRQLPRADLAARFGDSIARRLDQMTGDRAESVCVTPPSAHFQATRLLDYPIRDRTTLEIILRQLLEPLCANLLDQRRGGLEWIIRLFPAEGQSPIPICIRTLQPVTDVVEVLALASMHWDQAFQSRSHSRSRRPRHGPPPPRAIGKVQVSVPTHAPVVRHQRLLFEESPDLDRGELSRLVNRLSCRLGPSRIVRPRLRRQALPEQAFAFTPLLQLGRSRKSGSTSFPTAPFHRPLLLFSPPLAIRSVTLAPQTGIPREFTFRPPPLPRSSTATSRTADFLAAPAHGDHHIVACWGSERIESGWWQGRTARRDYWRIEMETGQQYWIFRDLRTNRWFLHGCFG